MFVFILIMNVYFIVLPWGESSVVLTNKKANCKKVEASFSINCHKNSNI
jgi:hypothetical protein